MPHKRKTKVPHHHASSGHTFEDPVELEASFTADGEVDASSSNDGDVVDDELDLEEFCDVQKADLSCAAVARSSSSSSSPSSRGSSSNHDDGSGSIDSDHFGYLSHGGRESDEQYSNQGAAVSFEAQADDEGGFNASSSMDHVGSSSLDDHIESEDNISDDSSSDYTAPSGTASKCCGAYRFRVFVFLAVLLFVGGMMCLILIPMSMHKVKATEFALSYDTTSKKLGSEALRQGLYNLGPTGSLIKFNATQKTETIGPVWVISKDGLEVELLLKASFTINEADVKDIVEEWVDEAGLISYIRKLVNSSMYDIALNYNLREFYSTRHLVQMGFKDHLMGIFEAANTHCTLQFIQIENVEFATEVSQALLATTVAKQDVQNSKMERAQKVLESEITLNLTTLRSLLAVLEAQQHVDRIAIDSTAAVLLERRRMYSYSLAFSNISVDVGLGGKFFVNSYLPNIILRTHENGTIFVDGD